MQNLRLENLNIWIKIIKRLYSLVLLAIWGWLFYQTFLIYIDNKDLIHRVINLEFLEDRTMLDPLITLGIHSSKIFGIFIASLIIFVIIKKICIAIPLPTSFINKWNNTNQITPMLAHRLINHYSYTTHLSFYELINYYNLSQSEASILSHNFNNKNLEGLFRRFEPTLVNEIIIYNNYFPYMNTWQTIKTFVTGKPFRKPMATPPTVAASSVSIEQQPTIISQQEPTLDLTPQTRTESFLETDEITGVDDIYGIYEPSLEIHSPTLEHNEAISSFIDKEHIDKKDAQNQEKKSETMKDPSNPFFQKPPPKIHD